jgi:hypothetical protein
MNRQQTLVYEFMKKHDLTMNIKNIQHDVDALLRLRLVVEELAELIKAVHERNLVEVADGLGDLMYVVYGTGVTYGLKIHGKTPVNFMGEPTLMRIAQVVECLAEVTQAVGDFAYALEMFDLLALETSLSLIIESCINFAETTNLPIEDIFEAIHESNMTKEKLTEFNKGGKGQNFIPVNLKIVLWPEAQNGLR